MKILYATDGSEGGLGPARFLASLGHHADVVVHIVTVLDTQRTPEQENCSGVLSSAEMALGDFPGSVTTEIARGNTLSEIVEALLQAADSAAADLIAVGASGHSAMARFFLGSVAESVARYARQPVLVTRPLRSPLREVIVGVDTSEGSAAAASFVASRFPRPLICALKLTHVVPQPVFGAIGDPLFPGAPDYLALEMANREARNRARLQAEALAGTLRSANGGCRIEVEAVALGNPASELIRIADEQGAGLIVVGSQGLTGISRFLLGSVSERVLRHAHCSVLIVK